MVFHVEQGIHHRIPRPEPHFQLFKPPVQLRQVLLQLPAPFPCGKALDDGKGVLHVMLHAPYAGIDALHLLHVFLQAAYLVFEDDPAALFPVPADHILKQLHPVQDGEQRQEQDCGNHDDEDRIPVIQHFRYAVL